MKTRSGFVSNSSTTSFLIVGYKYLDNAPKASEILERLNPAAAKEVREKLTQISENSEWDIEDLSKNSLSDIFNLNYRTCGYSGEVYIGRTLAKGTNGVIYDFELKFDELQKIASEVKEAFKSEEEPSLLLIDIAAC